MKCNNGFLDIGIKNPYDNLPYIGIEVYYKHKTDNSDSNRSNIEWYEVDAEEVIKVFDNNSSILFYDKREYICTNKNCIREYTLLEIGELLGYYDIVPNYNCEAVRQIRRMTVGRENVVLNFKLKGKGSPIYWKKFLEMKQCLLCGKRHLTKYNKPYCVNCYRRVLTKDECFEEREIPVSKLERWKYRKEFDWLKHLPKYVKDVTPCCVCKREDFEGLYHEGFADYLDGNVSSSIWWYNEDNNLPAESGYERSICSLCLQEWFEKNIKI